MAADAFNGRVLIIGLGPGDGRFLTAAARELWDATDVRNRYTRTDRHPAVAELGAHRSFDEVYDQATNFSDVYPRIAEALVAHCRSGTDVLYAVPGSPMVAERTVELLQADPRVTTVIQPALSFLDLAWARLGVDPLASGVRLVDGQRFASEAAGQHGPLLVAQCDTQQVLSDIKLSIDDWPSEPVVVLQRLGLPDEQITALNWADLDRVIVADHLTSLFIPVLGVPVGRELLRFEELVADLRRRCPWDSTQTHGSLRRHLLEESYEVLDVLDRLGGAEGEPAETDIEDLEEELGDLLFQVFLHAAMAAEAGWFTVADVARGVYDKLVRRHPHLYGDATATDPASLSSTWEAIKAAEKAEKAARAANQPSAASMSPFANIPTALPALAYAAKLYSKAIKLDLRPDFSRTADPTDGVDIEGPGAEGVGAALFATVCSSVRAGIDPEEALRDVARAFRAARELPA